MIAIIGTCAAGAIALFTATGLPGMADVGLVVGVLAFAAAAFGEGLE